MSDAIKTLELYFKELPDNFQKAITNSSWETSIKKIGNDNNLNPEKNEALEIETRLVLYGIEETEDYVSNIIQEMSLNEPMAIKIADAVSKNIFQPIMQKARDIENSTKIGTNESEKKAIIPETVSSGLPMIEEGEVAHDVPHVEPATDTISISLQEIKPEKPEPAPAPKYNYPGGADPYREPLH
jgi:hypothetical protein